MKLNRIHNRITIITTLGSDLLFLSKYIIVLTKIMTEIWEHLQVDTAKGNLTEQDAQSADF